MTLSAEEIQKINGSIKIKNISGAALSLDGYGQYEFSIDEEVDLLASETDVKIKADNYYTAKTMIGFASVGIEPRKEIFELAQKIINNKLIITSDVQPNVSLLVK